MDVSMGVSVCNGQIWYERSARLRRPEGAESLENEVKNRIDRTQRFQKELGKPSFPS